jgi:hypothetical protein
MLPILDYAFFAERLHGCFAVAGHDGVTLTLATLDQGAQPSPGANSFSLLFRGPAQPALEQMTYMLDIPGVASFPLFIVPVARDQDGMQYQAIFN